MTNHTIYFGDSRNMSDLRDESVRLIITSPPYWQLKDYGTDAQIGFNDSYEDYINHMNLVWKECERVLSKGCRLCINIGDQFARSVYYGRYKVIPIRTEIIRFCETLGMDYMGAVIWQKTTTTHTSGGGAVMGSYPYPRNGILKIDYEFILIFKKQGNAPKPSKAQKEASRLTNEEWKTYFSSHWNFPGVRQDGHLAMFPEELPVRLIKMFSFAGETVLDPFAGSGTTALAAMHLGRNSVGYEINDSFRPLIEKKLATAGDGHELRFLSTSDRSVPSLETLPYLFRDPLKIDKQVDVKKHLYGSKIDSATPDTEKFYTVKKICSPSLFLLNDGSYVRLIGVVDIPARQEKAIRFLTEKLKKRRIFLRADAAYAEGAGCIPLRYVYLDNKTFINNHLIRTGLVGVDREHSYRFQKKFLESLPM